MPTERLVGSRNVAVSATDSGSNRTTSAAAPTLMTPWSWRANAAAVRDVIFATASGHDRHPVART